MSETRKYIETTASNCIVSVDMAQSHAVTHLQEQSRLWELTQEVLRKSIFTPETHRNVLFETDLGRDVGVMDLVETDPAEQRIYAIRQQRETYMPFVKRDERPLTSFVTIVLKRLDFTQLDPQILEPALRHPDMADLPHFDLYTTYIGRKTPALPGDSYASEESLPFWMGHALVWGSQVVQEDTIRYDCPWPLEKPAG